MDLGYPTGLLRENTSGLMAPKSNGYSHKNSETDSDTTTIPLAEINELLFPNHKYIEIFPEYKTEI